MRKTSLGKVILEIEYVVDLNDPNMIVRAKKYMLDELMAACKYNELAYHIKVTPSPTSKIADIPSFLII